MKKCRFEPYQKRLEKQLPPIGTHQIDYLKQKYGHQIRTIFFYFYEHPKELEQEEFLHGMFNDLFYDDNKYLITSLLEFENWVFSYLSEKKKDDEMKTKFPGSIIEEYLIGSRMFRSWDLDMIADKYFEICVQRARKVGIAKPLEVVRMAFENAENYYLEIDEEAENFLHDVQRVINCYCMYEKCGMLMEDELEEMAY
jgi:hypothetical protein